MSGQITGRCASVGSRTRAVQLRTFKALPTLLDRFPRVRMMNIRWSWRDGELAARGSSERIWNFVPTSRAHFRLDCPTPGCVDGGCDLSSIIANMVEVGDSRLSGRMLCGGWRPSGDLRLVPCGHAVHYEIRLAWKDG